jgi:hypothetical protein
LGVATVPDWTGVEIVRAAGAALPAACGDEPEPAVVLVVVAAGAEAVGVVAGEFEAEVEAEAVAGAGTVSVTALTAWATWAGVELAGAVSSALGAGVAAC